MFNFINSIIFEEKISDILFSIGGSFHLVCESLKASKYSIFFDKINDTFFLEEK